MITAAQTKAADVYTDLNGLNSITQLGKTDKDQALKEVAQQFESMFVKMMMKSMRDANAVFSEDSMFNSKETEFYQQMYDDQIAVEMTNTEKGQGVGLADVIYRQLKQSYNGDKKEEGEREWQPIGDRRSSWHHIAKPEIQALNQDDTQSLLKPIKVNSIEPVNKTESSLQGKKQTQYKSAEQFIQDIYPVAKKVAQEMNVNPLAIVAQAALETGWGKHMISDQQGNNSFNYFGIKADQRWQGDSVEVTTHEFRQNAMLKEKAHFRSYDSLESGIKDYAQFLQSPRYQKALQQGENLDGYAKELQQAGYATDPKYAEKISRIAQSDTMVQALKQIEQGIEQNTKKQTAKVSEVPRA